MNSFNSRIVAVVPASGKSIRFGSDKRKALIDGTPMLERVVRALNDAGIERVIVVDNNPEPERGMFSSIQIGLAQACGENADVVLVHPADMPFVLPGTIQVIAEECARAQAAVCPRHNAKRGHPLAFPRVIALQLLDVPPSTPLNEAFAAIGLVRREFDVDDPGVLRDVDVPGDLTAQS